ncbi:MAG: TetR/AcrR family transcriptional regulator [Sandaracinaceae bacterium]|nr:TetR/AcrR family transcriptional regulator [Sandaracinaceae bacterium]
MSKGEDTRRAILREAMELAATAGLEGLTIGELAKATGMSKSGLFAHFKSKEELQAQVLEQTRDRFINRVVAPALKEARGVPRIRELFTRWLRWETEQTGGCVFLAAATELDDRPGPVRDRLVAIQRDWIDTLRTAARIAVEEKHLSKGLDLDQFAWELWSIGLSYHYFHRLMRAPDAAERAQTAFERLLERS